MKPQSTTPQPEAPAPKFKTGQKVYLKSDTNISQVVDNDPKKFEELWQAAPISREVEGFTPGEWEFNQEENTVSKYRIYSTKDGRNVGWFDYDEETKESELANVTLIASAPTLYRENQQQAKDIEELKNGLMIAQNYIENFIAKGGIGEAEKDLLLVTELINRLK